MAFVTLLRLLFCFFRHANSAASITVKGLLSMDENGGFFVVWLFWFFKCMSNIPGGETICILKGFLNVI